MGAETPGQLTKWAEALRIKQAEEAAKRAAEMAEAVRVPSLLPALLPAPSPAHAFLHKLFCALKPRVAAQQKSAAAAGDDDWDDDWDEEEDEVRRAPPLLPLRCAVCARSSGRSRLCCAKAVAAAPAALGVAGLLPVLALLFLRLPVPALPFLLLFLDRFKPSSHPHAAALPQDEEDWEEYDEL